MKIPKWREEAPTFFFCKKIRQERGLFVGESHQGVNSQQVACFFFVKDHLPKMAVFHRKFQVLTSFSL